jgi:hypothetical protein
MSSFPGTALRWSAARIIITDHRPPCGTNVSHECESASLREAKRLHSIIPGMPITVRRK